MAVNLTHVVRRFLPREWGGIETLVVNSSLKLAERGYKIKVFTTNSMEKKKHETVQGLDVTRFSFFYPYLGLRGDQWAAFDRKGGNAISFPMFLGLLQDKQVDVVQLFTFGRLGAMIATACKLKGIPYIINMQGGFAARAPKEELEQFQRPLAGTLDWGKPFGALFGSRRLMANADAIACAGGHDYDYAKQTYPGKPVHFLPCCVDTAYFGSGPPGAFRKKHGLEQKRLMLSVGRIDTQKNQKLIVRAMPELLKTFENLHLVLIGSVTVADYYRELQELVRSLGLEKHVLIIDGLKPDSPDLLGAYADCDLFVLASIQECGATVVLEAMSAGLPVVASNAGGLPWIINDGVDGLLFESNDVGQLTRQVTRVLEDDRLAETIRSGGIEAARTRFDWQVVAGQLAGICDEVIAAKKGGTNGQA